MDTPLNHTLWGHLHWLVVLAQQGSYTAAARRLGVSKAAVSQRISELERLAGVPLVQRTTRSVRLTEAGQRLVDDTRAPFDAIAHSFASVRDLAGTPRGRLRVTAPVALSRQQLVPRLADFLRQYPEVRLELELSDRFASLAMEGLDLAIRHSDQVPDTHVAWRLCDTRSVLVASPGYLAQRGQPDSPQALAQHDCLHYPRSGDTPTWTFERGTERLTIPVRGPLAANNSEALRDAALADLGIALLPDFSAQASLRSGQLQQVLPEWANVGPFARQLYAIRPYSAHVPLAVTALVQHLRQSLAGGFDLHPLQPP
ncbi:LysR family transcriptional regulator [Curvibacter sp. HBC61]|uniref:LysR family transcriptional regulator n=1 Tax=Curvibacter cyanobacteriorum TaxID=3026422 RepID=A0ABT5MSF7_9BURK|nr:LysR family transcriptional regulator [Curvibacter sp. HBC61]MDD0836974.1 LysR family transcriptional regulator [Curvibacter sp. HBC61]